MRAAIPIGDLANRCVRMVFALASGDGVSDPTESMDQK
ncbi:hypothetical protein MM3A0810R_5099 [Mycobacteroides abscessus 3A-0810-R]|nr:hypothetical protein MM3A0810R_5099 [Mycobacteroides abscessus 3A-0810-R]